MTEYNFDLNIFGPLPVISTGSLPGYLLISFHYSFCVGWVDHYEGMESQFVLIRSERV